MKNQKYEILTSDNRRVWINGITGECVGRFDKRFGIDIHNTLEKTEQTGIQCLFCTRGKMSHKDWLKFVYEMGKNYGILVDTELLKW